MTESQGPPTRCRGAVKWFNSAKGFGFITLEGTEDEIFVHQARIQFVCINEIGDHSNIDTVGFRSLREGEEVEFDLVIGDDGKQKAFHVTGPDGAPPKGSTDTPPRQNASPLARGGGVRPFDPNYAAAAAYNAYQQASVAAGRGRGSPGTPPGGYFQPVHPDAYMGYYPVGPAGPYGAAAYPAMFNPNSQQARGGGRGGYFPGGRNWVGARPPPPGQPGFSSGLQVVVHNLPWDCTWQQLKDAFNSCGEIERADVVFDSRGRSRGFGIVRFLDSDVAERAVEKMNNSTIGGRVVSVRIDRFA